MFSNIDFISFVAGVLELFSGFSIISFLELLYVFIYFIFYRFTKKKKVNRREAWTERDKNTNISEVFRLNPVNFMEYFTRNNLHVKIFWIFSCGMSFFLCIVLIIEVKRKIPESRVIAIEDHSKLTENVSSEG